MQPRPMAETSSPPWPNRRLSMPVSDLPFLGPRLPARRDHATPPAASGHEELRVQLDQNGYYDLPPGKIASVVTYLEMRAPPDGAAHA